MKNKNGHVNGRDGFTKALRISPLCKSICVLKSIFGSVFLRRFFVYVYISTGTARISFSLRNIVRVPGRALEGTGGAAPAMLL